VKGEEKGEGWECGSLGLTDAYTTMINDRTEKPPGCKGRSRERLRATDIALHWEGKYHPSLGNQFPLVKWFRSRTERELSRLGLGKRTTDHSAFLKG